MNNITFTFTSILQDIEIQKTFYNLLKEQGIDVKIESNEVPNAISRDFEY